MITVEVSTRGLEFDEVVKNLSGPLRQKLIEKLADVAKISGLLALVGTEVAVSGSAGGLIDGNWNLDSFEPSKNGPGPVYSYVMRLSKGKENITFG